MNKIPFSHESNDFTISIGISNRERKAMSDLMAEYLTKGADRLKEKASTKEEIEPQQFSMSTTIEYMVQNVPFKMKAQHYILIGVMLEKSLSMMESSKMMHEIDSMIKELRLEMKTEEQQDAIKN